MFQYSPSSEMERFTAPLPESVNRLLEEAHAVVESARDLSIEGSPSEQRYLSALSMAFNDAVDLRVPTRAMLPITAAFHRLRDNVQKRNLSSFTTTETFVHADAIDFHRYCREQVDLANTVSASEPKESLSGYSLYHREEVSIPSSETLLRCARVWREREELIVEELASAVYACKKEPGSKDREMDLSLASRVAVTEFLGLISSAGMNNNRISAALFSLLQDSIAVARTDSCRSNLEKRVCYVKDELTQRGLL